METELVTDKGLTTARVRLSNDQTILDVTRFVAAARELPATESCTVRSTRGVYDGKSILAVLSAELASGELVEICAPGDDTRMRYLLGHLRTSTTPDDHQHTYAGNTLAARPYTSIDTLVVTNK